MIQGQCRREKQHKKSLGLFTVGIAASIMASATLAASVRVKTPQPRRKKACEDSRFFLGWPIR
jgi:hypothetical protein